MTTLANVIIMSNDGGTDTPRDYNAFLNAGGHLLVISASNYQTYYDWVRQYVSQSGNVGSPGWGTLNCTPHYAASGSHPVTQWPWHPHLRGDRGELSHGPLLGHAAAPAPRSIGNSCLGGDRGSIVVRRYASGGTFTYISYDIPASTATPPR